MSTGRPSVDWLLVAAAVGAGLAGGFLLAFSVLVMPALRDLPAPDGVRAMQSINRTAKGPAVLGLLVGTAALAAVVGWRAISDAGVPNRGLVLAGAALSVAGVVVTGVGNVPLNEALAEMDADAPATEVFWARFLDRWVPWNTVRAVAGVVASAMFAGALLR